MVKKGACMAKSPAKDGVKTGDSWQKMKGIEWGAEYE